MKWVGSGLILAPNPISFFNMNKTITNHISMVMNHRSSPQDVELPLPSTTPARPSLPHSTSLHFRESVLILN